MSRFILSITVQINSLNQFITQKIGFFTSALHISLIDNRYLAKLTLYFCLFFIAIQSNFGDCSNLLYSLFYNIIIHHRGHRAMLHRGVLKLFLCVNKFKAKRSFAVGLNICGVKIKRRILQAPNF